MYKELRSVTDPNAKSASTPEMWATNFASSRKVNLIKKFKLLVDKRYRLICKYFKKGGTILDAGCGFGEWVSILNTMDFRVSGLDYSEELIGRLKITYPSNEWIQGRIEKIPLGDSTCDGIISWGVIEHNEDGPREALSEFFRVLKPGGHIIVTVPFEDTLAIQMSKGTPEIDARGAQRFFQYYMTKMDLENIIRECGFEVFEEGLCPPAALGKVLPNFYTRLARFPKIRLLMIHLFGAIFMWKTDWYFMLYGVGRKPVKTL